MKTENWQIEYDMKTSCRVIHVKEALLCEAGYHQKLIDWYQQNNFTAEINPLYKVRGNYIELLSLGLEGGRDLPLEQRTELIGGELLASEDHQIVLIAPNGKRYVRREF